MPNSLLKILEKETEKTLSQILIINKKLNDSRIRKVEAASFGDLKENSAYTESENDIGLFSYDKVLLDDKLKDLDNLKSQLYKSSGYIGIKSFFKCKRNDTGETLEFYVVYPSLGNAENQLLATDSKLGKAVLGKKKGDICVVKTGLVSYTVTITYVN